MSEDANIVKIRNFVTKCLESAGAIVEFTKYNYAEALIPDDLAEYFDGKGYFNLAFDFDVARKNEDSEFVTYGSYFLDKVIELASQMGLTCKRHIVDDGVELKNPSQKLSGKIVFRNCRASFLTNAPAIYHYILFNFKVSYISDERDDRIVRLLVNLNNGHIDNRMLEAIESAIFTDSSHTRHTIEPMCSVDDAYHIAATALESQIQPVIQEFSRKIESRLANEKERIREYYDQIDGELNLKRKKLVDSEKKEGLNSIDEKLRLSGIERQRRINEIEEKNVLRVYATLFNATLISQTKLRNKFHVKRGAVERDVYVIWNPILNDVDPLICEVCGRETHETELCPHSHLGCIKCIRACSVCGSRICKGCGTISECSLCGDPLCDQCKTVCEDCGDILCRDHMESCTCKEKKRQEEREAEEKRREMEQKRIEEKINEFRKYPLQNIKLMRQYNEDYVRKNLDKLDDDWKNAVYKAHLAIAANDKVNARAILQKLSEKYPENAWVKAQTAFTYERITQYVITLGEQAINLAPNMALTHMAMAHIHQKLGKIYYKRSIEEYERTIKLVKEEEMSLAANAHYQIGKMLYEYERNPWEARKRWEMALMADKDWEPARKSLDSLWFYSKRRR